MNIAKLTVGALAVVALGAAGFGVAEFRAAGAAAEAQTVARRSGEEVRAKIASLEAKLAAEERRVAAVESDNVALAGAVQKAQAALAKPAASISREVFAERLKRALALENEGDGDAALRELLWCYDTAVGRPELRAGVQLFPIVSALGTLAKRNPAAEVALRERFEQGRQRVLGNADDLEPLSAMSLIARTLKDDQAMVTVFDAIPEADARRTKVAIYAIDGLIAAKRYAEVLVGRNYRSMSSSFEINLADRTAGLVPAEMAERARSAQRSYAVSSAAKNIEVLAGAGDLAHARELAGRVLTYDGTETTRALLQKHLERAGQPGLLAKEGGK